MMKPTVKAITLLLAGLVLVGCDELVMVWGGGGFATRIISYPMRVGNTWVYERSSYMYNFRQTDTTYVFPRDTTRSLVTGQFTRQLKIPTIPNVPGDSLLVTEFMSLETGHTVPSSSYYSFSSNSLFLHGYLGGSLIIPGRPGLAHGDHLQRDQLSFVVAGRSFRTMRDLERYVEEPLFAAHPDTIIREYPPLLGIRYPLVTGDQWTYRPTGRPFRIDKRTGPAGLDRALGLRYYEVRWMYDIDGNGEWDDFISLVDRISSRGLIRRTVDIRNIRVYNLWGEEVGTTDYHDEYILVSVTIR
jgi:hypothetical protein